MATVNFGRREILCKIVYYGPGLCGKTTNLQAIHGKVPEQMRGNLTSVATKQDRTLFFDLLPLEIGKIRDFKVRLQLYTVPGQVYYNASRRIVLKGVDGIVFVADSQVGKMEENIESLANLKENLQANGVDPGIVPIVLQYNKRDLNPVYSIEELNKDLNTNNLGFYESVATTGHGVFNTLKGITAIVVSDIKVKLDSADKTTTAPKPAAQPAPQAQAAAEPQAAAPKPAAPTAPKPQAQQPMMQPQRQAQQVPGPQSQMRGPQVQRDIKKPYENMSEPDSDSAKKGFWKKVSNVFKGER